MNIREVSSQFSISIFSQNVNLGTKIKHALSTAEFETHFYADVDELILKINEEPPHIIIFDTESSIMASHEFIEKCLNISAEIKFIFLAKANQFSAFQNYRKYNLASILNVDEVSIGEQVIYICDGICESIFRTYHNEQILEELTREKAKVENLQHTLDSERKAPQVRPYQTRIAEYKTARSKEELLDIFFDQTPTQSWIYLKLVSSIQTFICVTHTRVPNDWVEGLSFKVPLNEGNFLSRLVIGDLPTAFLNYLKNKFNVEHIKFIPLLVKDKLEGVLVSTQEISSEVAEDFALLSLIYSAFVIESEPRQFVVEDNLTGFYNKLFYDQVLSREFERSRRVFTGLSILKISIDMFAELETSLGSEIMEEIILKVSEVIKESSRLNDYLCRTSNNEFSIILTNCDHKGAAVRAERLRQAMHRTHLNFGGSVISVSQGISEYPSLAKNVEELNSGSERALQFIEKKGGDKICIQKPQPNHQPDFKLES